MKKIKFVIIILLFGIIIKSSAQTAADTTAIKATVMNYIEGFLQQMQLVWKKHCIMIWPKGMSLPKEMEEIRFSI